MAEFVIVGGGVYGAAVAFWLAEKGAEVRLLEAKKIGNGASAGPGRRGTRANGRDIRELTLAGLAHDLWPSLHERLDVPQFFERTGHLMLIEREQDLAPARARALVQNAYGTETHFLSAEQVREREPELSDSILGALFCPLDGASDHTAVTDAFAAAARRVGAQICEDTPVERLDISGGRAVAIVTAEGERIEVGRGLFILANAGVDALIGDRLTLPVTSRTYQVILTKPVPDLRLTHLIGHMSRILALKAEAGNRVMVSGGLPGIWDPETETGSVIEASMEANFADAVAVYPRLSDIEIELGDADHLESSAIDDIPVIDVVPGTDNAIYAAAWCGHGWAIAPKITQLLAEWGISGERPALLAPFSHSRFVGLGGS